MRKEYSSTILIVIFLSLLTLSCNDDGLSADDITGIYTAKKIGSPSTFPLTIYSNGIEGTMVEAEWTNSLVSIPVQLTDDGFKIDTQFSSNTIGGNATFDDNVITIYYSINGGTTFTIIASR